MYFATGSPKIYNVCKSNIDIISSTTDQTFHSSAPSSIIEIKKNEDATLFAAINSQAIYMWNIRPTVLLSSVHRSKSSIEEHGENKHVIWNEMSYSIVVLTSKNYLYFYDIMNEKNNIYQYNFNTRHEYYNEENTGIPKKRIIYKFFTKIDEEIKCGAEYDNEILLGTDKSLITIKWDGRIVQKIPIHEISFLGLSSNDEPSVYITEISKSKISPFSTWILSNKSIFLVSKNSKKNKSLTSSTSSSSEINTSNNIWVGIQFSINEDGLGDICISKFHPKFKLIALGTTTGEVLIYNIKEINELPEFSHHLSFSEASGIYSDIQLGKISSMDWTDDGYAIAIGLYGSGFSIWSVYGRFLMSTITEDTITQSKEISDFIQDDYFAGVRNIFWGSNGYELYMLPTLSLDKEFIEEIYVLQFAKHPLVNSMTQDNLHHIYIHNSYSIFFSIENGIDSDTDDSSSLIQWQTIQIPEMYLLNNWPIRYSSIDSTGQYIALAGKHGFIHYSFNTARWKLFGNVLHEQSITCCGGLVWYKNIIIIACKNEETNKYEIRYYNRDLNLDNTKVLFVEHLPEVLYMDILENNLLVYTIDNKVCHFVINYIKKANQIDVTYYSELSIAEFIEFPRTVQSLSWFPLKLSRPDSQELLMCPIIILYQGNLGIIIREKDKMYIYNLSKNIEYYWTSIGWDVEIGKLYNSLWLFDGNEVKVWTNILLPKEMNSLWKHEFYSSIVNPSFTFKLDFCPFLILLYKGIIMGIGQSMSLKCSMEIVYFKPEKKTHLFLPYIIKYLLSNNMYDEAVRFVDCFQNLGYFGHALELLLHYVLEEEVESKKHSSDNSELLPLVIKFIKNYNQYLDIIVQCARKTEVLVWEYFFSIVGDPKILFKQCINDGRLRTATSYLLILQTLEPLDVSGKMAVDLLEKAFEMEDYNLCQELVRFLSSIDDSGYEIFSILKKSDTNVIKENMDEIKKEAIEIINSDKEDKQDIEDKEEKEKKKDKKDVEDKEEKEAKKDEEDKEIQKEKEEGDINEDEDDDSKYNDDYEMEAKKIIELNKIGEKNESYSKDISPIKSDLIHIEKLIIRHAYTLLSQNKIRSLGKLSKQLGFPLKEWLITEKKNNNEKLEVENWSETFISLHEQFKWPFPDDMTSIKKYINDYIEKVIIPENDKKNLIQEVSKKNENTQDKDDEGNYKLVKKRLNSSIAVVPLIKKSIINELDEINDLLDIMQEVKMDDWILLLSSMTFNILLIRNTIQKSSNTSLLDNLKDLLQKSKSKGYHLLLATISDVMANKYSAKPKTEEDN